MNLRKNFNYYRYCFQAVITHKWMKSPLLKCKTDYFLIVCLDSFSGQCKMGSRAVQDLTLVLALDTAQRFKGLLLEKNLT